MVRTLKNTNMKPLNHSSYLRLQVLCQSFCDVEEKLLLLNDLTLTDLKTFIPELLSQVCQLKLLIFRRLSIVIILLTVICEGLDIFMSLTFFRNDAGVGEWLCIYATVRIGVVTRIVYRIYRNKIVM